MRAPVVTCASFSPGSSAFTASQSVIERRIESLWVRHRTVLSIRVNAGMPLHNTPPKIETVLKGDSLMQRLIAENFRKSQVQELAANAQPPETVCRMPDDLH